MSDLHRSQIRTWTFRRVLSRALRPPGPVGQADTGGRRVGVLSTQDRSRTGSSAAYWSRAPAGSPAAPGPVGLVGADGERAAGAAGCLRLRNTPPATAAPAWRGFLLWLRDGGLTLLVRVRRAGISRPHGTWSLADCKPGIARFRSAAPCRSRRARARRLPLARCQRWIVASLVGRDSDASGQHAG
jgi:hypothetical protein